MTEAGDPGSASSSLPGRVVFVGAGPGSADLITLRGAERLASADVVLHDALTDPALRRFAPRARWIDVGKRGFADSTGQATINALLVRYAREVGVVVRLKGGDPSVFGRLEEELLALAAAGIDCEVVPGVTAALAAAADSQRPLTRRGSGRTVGFATAATAATPRADDNEVLHHRRAADTEVYYMAGKQLASLGRRLVDAGWPPDTPALVASRAGWPDALASEHTVAALAAGSLLHAGRPTVVTVGAGARPVKGGASNQGAGGASGARTGSMANETRDPPGSPGAGGALDPAPPGRKGSVAGTGRMPVLPTANSARAKPPALASAERAVAPLDGRAIGAHARCTGPTR